MLLSRSTWWQPSAKHSKITGDYANWRFYFRVSSLWIFHQTISTSHQRLGWGLPSPVLCLELNLPRRVSFTLVLSYNRSLFNPSVIHCDWSFLSEDCHHFIDPGWIMWTEVSFSTQTINTGLPLHLLVFQSFLCTKCDHIRVPQLSSYNLNWTLLREYAVSINVFLFWINLKVFY